MHVIDDIVVTDYISVSYHNISSHVAFHLDFIDGNLGIGLRNSGRELPDVQKLRIDHKLRLCANLI